MPKKQKKRTNQSGSYDKKTIENKKVYITASQDKASVYFITDEQLCSKCGRYGWIVYLEYTDTVKEGEIRQESGLCVSCTGGTGGTGGTGTDGLAGVAGVEQSIIVCQPRNCPFCARQAKCGLHICQECIDTVVANTKELYEICTIDIRPCSCKYCKIFGRIDKEPN